LLTNSKIHYRRNILISIILSELLVISIFIFSPDKSVQDKKFLYDEPVILFDKMPLTVQKLPTYKQKPGIPAIYISDQVEAFELLDDVTLQSKVNGQNAVVSSESADQTNIRPVRSAPRQIFEVVPANDDNKVNGRLQLSLKINENGRVIDHRILFNSLDCNDCLNDIINAAYRSRWEPASINGKNADYWVMKSYTFK
jgi:hypothetical protein